jgi:uncharacterized protein YwgA
VYIFSDGFADQLGGPRGKKFLSRKFKETLLQIQDKSMDMQKTILNKILEDWQGNLEQVDDILVFGIRWNLGKIEIRNTEIRNKNEARN